MPLYRINYEYACDVRSANTIVECVRHPTNDEAKAFLSKYHGDKDVYFDWSNVWITPLVPVRMEVEL